MADVGEVGEGLMGVSTRRHWIPAMTFGSEILGSCHRTQRAMESGVAFSRDSW